jgi:ubiquinone/menaquinone biosynthesis C-methylase UbiE
MDGSDLYDFFMAPLGWLGLTEARRRLVAGLSGRVLELGTGTGLLLPLYPAGCELVAIDFDPGGLPRAQRRAPRAHLACADAARLPFADGSFDAVVESLVLCSVPDPAAALAEARRVLRPGGELRLLEHVRPPGPGLAWLADHLTPAWKHIAGGCHLDRDPLPLLAPAGFALERRTTGLRGIGESIVARAV